MSNNDDVCTAGAIRELCEARDSGLTQFVNSNQLSSIIIYIDIIYYNCF